MGVAVIDKPTIPVRNVTPATGNIPASAQAATANIDYRTWDLYTRDTFYLTTQYWAWDGGDALVGLGPGNECHVVVRLWDDVHEFRGDYSIQRALLELGFNMRVDHEWHERQAAV